MSEHRPVGHRGAVRAANIPNRLTVKCETCGADIGMRCFRLTSWMEDTDHEGGGFYTERTGNPHRPRRAKSEAASATVSDRGALRKELSRLAGKKMGGSSRIRVRQWSNSSRRTAEELKAKIAELSAMADVTPSQPLPHQRG